VQSSNGKDLTEMAYEKAKNILKNHIPLALLSGAKETIKDLLEEFEANL
jgi:trimethylamine--corrinoid protein Co-methyltransferase